MRTGEFQFSFALFILALTLAVFLLPGLTSNTYNATFSRYTMKATVSGPVSGRYVSGNNSSGYAKFAVPIETSRGLEIVNCNSTQCSALKEGDVVSLNCYNEWHYFSPDEKECRFDKLN